MSIKDKKDAKKLTEHAEIGDNQTNSKAMLASTDPRLVALVRFLARCAAERDFAQLIEESQQAADGGSDQGRIQ